MTGGKLFFKASVSIQSDDTVLDEMADITHYMASVDALNPYFSHIA